MSELGKLVERLRALGYEARAVASTERSYGPPQDYARLSEKEFSKVLSKVTSLAELEGIANRRRILKQNLVKYPPSHLDLIKRRKWELENA